LKGVLHAAEFSVHNCPELCSFLEIEECGEGAGGRTPRARAASNTASATDTEASGRRGVGIGLEPGTGSNFENPSGTLGGAEGGAAEDCPSSPEPTAGPGAPDSVTSGTDASSATMDDSLTAGVTGCKIQSGCQALRRGTSPPRGSIVPRVRETERERQLRSRAAAAR
jgi:hypothetical protein